MQTIVILRRLHSMFRRRIDLGSRIYNLVRSPENSKLYTNFVCVRNILVISVHVLHQTCGHGGHSLYPLCWVLFFICLIIVYDICSSKYARGTLINVNLLSLLNGSYPYTHFVLLLRVGFGSFVAHILLIHMHILQYYS